MDAWSTICIKNTADIVQACLRDPNTFIECLVKFSSVRGEVLIYYTDAVSRKEILSLYALPDEIKRHYWTEAKRESAGRLSLNPLKDLAKCLYFIDHLLVNS